MLRKAYEECIAEPKRLTHLRDAGAVTPKDVQNLKERFLNGD